MMGLFIVSKLLLMTLLLQPTEENAEWKTQKTPEPDNSVRFGEFCLRISDDSHWTSSESVTQLPTKSAQPTKYATQLPKQPTQPTKQAPKLPNQPTQPNRESTQLLEQPTTEPTHPDSQSTQPPTQPTPTYWESTQLPEQATTEPTHPDSQSTQPPTQPTPTYWESTQLPEQATQDQEIVTQEITVLSVMAALGLHSQVIDGCRCQDREKKRPTETSRLISIQMWPPSETCSSTEFIETLMDGSEVCVTVPGLLPYYDEFVRRQFQPAAEAADEKLLDTSPAPLDPTTELPITTPPSVTETKQLHDLNPQPTFTSPFIEYEYYNLAPTDTDRLVPICESCNIMTNLDNVDPKAVQSLNVKMQPFPCPAHVYVSLKDDKDLCLDSYHPEFKTMLEKLEIPPPHEDNFDRTPKNIIDGCRCQERENKLPTETSPVTSTRIWPPSETCSSTEFIETLMDGREVCVTASSLSAYLEFALPRQSEPTGKAASYEVPPAPPVVDIYPVDNQHGHHVLVGERGAAGPQYEHYSPPELSMGHITEMKTVRAGIEEPHHFMCIGCRPIENRNVDPKDVRSLEINVQSFGCPVLIHVSLKNEENFCVEMSQPWPEFRTLLKKLESQAH